MKKSPSLGKMLPPVPLDVFVCVCVGLAACIGALMSMPPH